MPPYLLDTNILVYSCEASDRKKHKRALQVIERLGREARAAVPAQALSEFSSVALQRLRPPMPTHEVYSQVEFFERVFPIVPLTPGIVLEAVRGVGGHAFSFYDAQIWAAAKLSQIPTVLSEDFSANATIEGVTFLNPLEAAFDLDDL